jgi:hypothetical protein
MKIEKALSQKNQRRDVHQHSDAPPATRCARVSRRRSCWAGLASVTKALPLVAHDL